MSFFSGRESPLVFAPNSENEDWIREWEAVKASDLVDTPLVVIDGDTAVEDACEALQSNKTECAAVKQSPESGSEPFAGLFDFADVNAFLTLAATFHTLSKEDLEQDAAVAAIVNAAKGDTGRVPVKLVCNLSGKNPLSILPSTATLIDLLALFAQGAHRVLIRAPESNTYLGYASALALLRYFSSSSPLVATSGQFPSSSFNTSTDDDLVPVSPIAPTWHPFLSQPLHSLPDLPSLSLHGNVAHVRASDLVLDAMRLMSTEGVRSVAVVADQDGSAGSGDTNSLILLSAISVTDIGRLVVPSQDKSILKIPVSQFVSMIKFPEGAADGADRFPVYSVLGASSLRYTIEKILATTAHRVYVTGGPSAGNSSATVPRPISPTATAPSGSADSNFQLRGIVSVVDVLSLFARLANLPDVDPSRMTAERRRRASSSSTGSASGQYSRITPAASSSRR